MSAEIESSASSWSWCETCEAMKPIIHDCGTETPSVHDEQYTEDIDYFSVEAYLRGWHGRGGQARARQALQKGYVQRGKTKTTKMQGWM